MSAKRTKRHTQLKKARRKDEVGMALGNLAMMTALQLNFGRFFSVRGTIWMRPGRGCGLGAAGSEKTGLVALPKRLGFENAGLVFGEDIARNRKKVAGFGKTATGREKTGNCSPVKAAGFTKTATGCEKTWSSSLAKAAGFPKTGTGRDKTGTCFAGKAAGCAETAPGSEKTGGGFSRKATCFGKREGIFACRSWGSTGAWAWGRAAAAAFRLLLLRKRPAPQTKSGNTIFKAYG